LPDLLGFARRYARELFGRLPEGAMIVLDNAQEAATESFAQLLEVFAEEIPEGINLVCISRTAPAASLMRQVSTERLASIDWDAMRLTLDETRQIATIKHKISDRILERLHQQSEGWAAGLTLMLARIEHTGDLPEAIAAQSREAIFSYFAGTLFDRQPADVRHVLLCTALLPRITPSLASKLTGNPNAGALLDSLHRRHLFTYRRHLEPSSRSSKCIGAQAGEPTYEYHALFRAFLLEKLREDYTPPALRRLSQDVAVLLEESGEIEAALELNRIAEDWDALARLLIDHAPKLLGQGRGQTLRDWIALLPASIAESRPYTQYWLGVASMPVDQRKAQVVLESAFYEFARVDNRVGQLLCASRIIEAIYRASISLPDQDQWVEVLNSALTEGFVFPNRDVEISVYCSLGLALFFRQPRHPALEASVERVSALLKEGLAPEQMVTAGESLVRYYNFAYRPNDAAWVINLVSPIADDTSIPPLNRLYWWGRVGNCLQHFGQYAEADAALRKAECLADYCPNHFAVGMIRMFRVALNVSQGRLADASERRAELQKIADPTQPMTVGIALHGQTMLAANTKPLQETIDLCRASLVAHEAAGHRFGELLMKMTLAALLAHTDGVDELARLLADIRAGLAGTFLAHYAAQVSIIEAYSALRLGQTQKACELVEAATSAELDSSFSLVRLIPRVLPTVLAFGLEQGIGTVRIKSWIRRFSIPPDNTTNQRWPWPAMVRCMGTFSICIDDQPLQFKGRPPTKPVELLKLLVTAGVDGLPSRAIADQLWPDLDGAAALVNVDTNVHRLRKLFKQDPLVVSDGRVAINDERCWVDAWALDQNCETASDVANDALQTKVRGAMHLYRGHFLDLEGEQSWAVAYRDKLRASLIRMVRAVGKSFEQEGRFADAIELYERAIKLDHLAEPIYRQWMLCHCERGEKAEALNVYRRCKEMLSVVLGMQPSAETQAIIATLKG
ncbi:MAG: BTAD domain-containing putative transcriptional regulator, partial [Betaproteobacteria bacterium]